MCWGGDKPVRGIVAVGTDYKEGRGLSKNSESSSLRPHFPVCPFGGLHSGL